MSAMYPVVFVLMRLCAIPHSLHHFMPQSCVSSSLLGNIYLGFILHDLFLSFWELWRTWMVLWASCYKNPKSVTHSLSWALCTYQRRWERINLDLHAGSKVTEVKSSPAWGKESTMHFRWLDVVIKSNWCTGRGGEIFEVCKLFCCLVVSLWVTELHISFRHRNLKITHVIS